MRRTTDKDRATIAALRKGGKTLREIESTTGLPVATIRRQIRKLHDEGRLSDSAAFGYRGHPPRTSSLVTALGRSGLRIDSLVTIEEARRLRSETDAGGYSGYNELLLELFRDWVAEKDAKVK